MRRRSKAQHPASRHGVALLFVISLIVVFFLFVTTFVAMSGSYLRTSDRKLRVERTEQLKPANVVDDVFYMLLRDVAAGHILRGHSLLSDQYGVELFSVEDASGEFSGTCDLVAFDEGYSNQVLRIQLTASLQPLANAQTINALTRASRDDFLGRWLTFADGPLAGVTMPILEYKFELLPNVANPTDVRCHFFVLAQPQERSWAFTAEGVAQSVRTRFVVNGRPFDGAPKIENINGQPVLVSESNETVDVVSDDPGTLLHNRNFFLARDARGSNAFPEHLQMIPSFHRYSQFAGLTIDPSITTWQQLRNAANSALRPSPLENPNFTGSNPNSRFFTPGTYASPMRTPNFVFAPNNFFADNGFNSAAPEHWSHLVNGLLGNDPAALSALGLALNSGLDVDADGDGRNDSIWIDIGLAPVAMPNGTRVKPLVAIKIEDLDGRLNLNAHGSLAELSRGANQVSSLFVPYGQGHGPAEVRLSAVLGIPALQRVLQTRYGLPAAGGPGVGAPDALGFTNPLHAARWFGFLDNVLPNLTGGIYSSPSDYQGQLVFEPSGQSVLPPWFVPPGNVGMSLPFAQSPTPLLTQIVDTPYEFNLFTEGSPYRYFNYATSAPVQQPSDSPDVDQPFSVADLEALLRAPDADFPQVLAAAMNLRSDALVGPESRRQILQALMTTVANNEDVRRQLTTHSFEVPALPANLAGVLRRHLLTRDLTGNTTQIDTTLSHFQPRRAFVTPAANDVVRAVEQQVLAMLGQDIVAGLPLNLDRRFGNGVDDNGSFSIDDYGDPFLGGGVESSGPQTTVTLNLLAGTPIDLDFDQDGGLPSSGDGDQFLARSAFARQLYVLMLMMVEPDYAVPASQLLPEAIRRRVAVAQWAINAVDFMDPDSTCTPFEFDVNPFNGWHVDGNLRTRPNSMGGVELGIELPVTDPFDLPAGPQNERFVVWGVERPDLLLTEAVGFHDHRSHIVGMSPRQGHMPIPSAFIELYNPNLVPFTDYQSLGDTHASLTPTEKGVNLRKLTPAGEPVYRLLVVKEQDRGLNPDWLISDFDEMCRDHLVNGNQRRFAQGGVDDIERTIFFANPSNLIASINDYIADNSIDLTTAPERVQLATGLVQHYPSTNDPLVVQPGQHAVVGSAGPHDQVPLTRNMTIFGRILGAPTDNTYDPAIHSEDRPAIRLNPGAPIEVGYFDTNAPAKMRLVPKTIGVPIDRVFGSTPPAQHRSMAFSGPVTGYPLQDSAGEDAVAEADGWFYETSHSDPFYTSMDDQISKYGEILDINDPNVRSYRHVVLQRLANPQQAFHPVLNPYLTFDDLAVNLNAYGGVGVDTQLRDTPGPVPGEPTMVTSSQRGRIDDLATEFAHTTRPMPHNSLVNNVENKNVWLRTPSGTWQVSTVAGSNDGIFPVGLTLFDPVNGYNAPEQFSLGAVNQAYASLPDTVPWLRIANRPVISQFELASVPIQSNGLLLEHVIWTNPRQHNHYIDDALLNTAANAGLRNATLFPDLMDRIPSYLFNFFGQTAAMRAPARLFEFTTVPSPFVGTETLLNPLARMAGGFGLDLVGVGGTTPGLMPDGPRYGAPYNFLSNRRIPGKLNLNTINYAPTWNAMMGSPMYTNPASNTSFGNVGTNNSFVGATHGRQTPLRHSPWLQNAERFNPGDLRSTRLPQSLPGLPPDRFYDTLSTLWGPVPAGPPVPMFDHQPAVNVLLYDTDRNEYFRNQKRQRMANMTTQRSSVFAVWITVGYFEMEEVAVPIPDNPNAPLQSVTFNNGLVELRTAVGREYGLDRGQVRRDRAFYVVDRSIPVGFFPGENLNVDKAVLTRRYLP